MLSISPNRENHSTLTRLANLCHELDHGAIFWLLLSGGHCPQLVDDMNFGSRSPYAYITSAAQDVRGREEAGLPLRIRSIVDRLNDGTRTPGQCSPRCRTFIWLVSSPQKKNSYRGIVSAGAAGGLRRAGLLTSNLFLRRFIGTIESRLLASNRPSLYCRYVDDIFVRVKDLQELQDLRHRFIAESELNFTDEEATNGRLPFLDVLVSAEIAEFKTTVFCKLTNNGLSALTGKVSASCVTCIPPSALMSDKALLSLLYLESRSPRT
ncbi:hypothetical protein GWK47_038117 [Chionoecetes opilio]|uniref:Reverse transcriptase domain-containing protein n=1 Tax=Chionoecetes opilio TaxID=41210 RepID=A0A8J5CM99_CHIOP|nr:hypothetical protein GWK47_038117 [Chionoecetes opilio]